MSDLLRDVTECKHSMMDDAVDRKDRKSVSTHRIATFNSFCDTACLKINDMTLISLTSSLYNLQCTEVTFFMCDGQMHIRLCQISS